MSRAQGSLEYLIIIAIVLAVSALVISYSTSILGGGKSSVSVTSCKQAAVDCKAAKMLSPNDICLPCESACKNSAGVELFDGATYCCTTGQAEMIFANSPGCYPCRDSGDCSAPTPVCLGNICVECDDASDCTSPTKPYCSSDNKCIACRDNNDCPQAGTVCSASHVCVPGCTDTKPCPSGQVCCGTDPNKACKVPACTSNLDCASTNILNDCKTPTCDGTGCAAVCNPTGANEGAGAFCKNPSAPYCLGYDVYIKTYACDGAGLCKETPQLDEDCGTCGYCEGAVCYDGYGSPTACAKTSCHWCDCSGTPCGAGASGCTISGCYNYCRFC